MKKESYNIIQLDRELTSLVKGCIKVWMQEKPILPCSFGGTSYYGLCDIGFSINVIPYISYGEIHDEI